MILASEIRKFQSYTDMAVAQQKDVDNFPMCFLFGRMSDEEIRKELKKNLGVDSLDECMRSPYGGIIRKDSLDFLELMFENHNRERKHFEEDYKHLVDSIVTEMCNHEYAYTRDCAEVLNALGRTEEIFSDKRFDKAWRDAERIVLKEDAA